MQMAAVLMLRAAALAAAAGTEAASFLDIPVGAGPAALGAAYTARATDAYAPVWNPAGLAHLDSAQMAGMHIPYLLSTRYEFLSVTVPFFDKTHGLGAAAQYFSSGDLDGRDEAGTKTADFSATFAAYSLAYGYRVSDALSFGMAGKVITEKISDASGSGYAVDTGILYQLTEALRGGMTLVNVGPGLKLVEESNALPTAVRAGALWSIRKTWDLAGEAVYRLRGPASGSLGVEYKYFDQFAARVGYDSSRIEELGAMAGLRGGVGIFYKGQEFSYAVAPFGDLGTAQYLSVVFRFSSEPPANRRALESMDFSEGFGDFNEERSLNYLLLEGDGNSLWGN